MNQKELAATFRKLGARDPGIGRGRKLKRAFRSSPDFSSFDRRGGRSSKRTTQVGSTPRSAERRHTLMSPMRASVTHWGRFGRAARRTKSSRMLSGACRRSCCLRSVTSSRIPVISSRRPEMSVGFSRKSIRRETSSIPSEGSMSRCLRLIRPSRNAPSSCGRQLTKKCSGRPLISRSLASPGGRDPALT